MKLAYLDLETTGVDARKHGVHQIAMILEVPGKDVVGIQYQVAPHPKAKIDLEALELGGIVEEDFMLYPSQNEVHAELTAELKKYVDQYNSKDKFTIVGYNNRQFDDGFFRAFFKQVGDQFFGSYFWANSIDVMVLATQALLPVRSGMKNFKLHTVAEELGISVDYTKLHDAMYDIQLTRQIYKKLI